MSKVNWTKEEIKEKLLTNDRWLSRSVVAIYEKQTYEEKAVKETKENNGVGFNGVDAAILSSFAEQISNGHKLSYKQLFIARKKMPKYAKQLAQIANSK